MVELSRRDLFKNFGAAAGGLALSGTLPLEWGAIAAVQAQTIDPDLHVLNRLTWGALPEDLDYLRSIGYEAWLEEQLHPDTLADPDGDEVVRQLPVLGLNRRDVHSLGFDGRVYNSIIRGMAGRAVASRRQLYERMVEFWADHFNIPAGDLSHDVLVMQREVLRKHALGKFRDLAIGTAQSPAMLYYLDQAYSTLEHPNENYARELLELHTLGVDGGYGESDVLEAARALTGWTVHDGTETGFYFDAEAHDSEPKSILGVHMPGGRGIEDGLHLISLLVNHPSNARFVCRKLCVRFVSDDPPESLVESAAQVWMDNDGEIVPVLRHIFTSDEFMQSAGMKLRRPLEFFIGALRATQTRVPDDWRLTMMMEELGQLPYGWNPPNGYPDDASSWISSGGLLARWNTAMDLTHGAWSDPDSGLITRLDELIGSPATVDELVQAAARRVFASPDLPGDLYAALVEYASDGEGAEAEVTPGLISAKLGTLFGLMLASPYYQWR